VSGELPTVINFSYLHPAIKAPSGAFFVYVIETTSHKKPLKEVF